MPTVAVIACVRNEADVLETFVRHALTYADRVTVADHGSVDATPLILESLRREGLPVEIRRLDGPAQRQAETLNGLLAESGADWTVPLDADEFLTAPGGDVRAAILALPQDAAAAVKVSMYVPAPGDGADLPRAARKRLAYDGFGCLKVAAVPAGLLTFGRLTPGNHGFFAGDRDVSRPADALRMAHVPFRSPAQLKAKALGWINNVLRTDARDCEAYHWREMFGGLLEGKLDTWEAAEAWALKYPRYLEPACPLDLADDPLALPAPTYPALAVRADPRLILEDLARSLGVAGWKELSFEKLAKAAESRARWLQEAEKRIDPASASS
jgi:hypothetical protein